MADSYDKYLLLVIVFAARIGIRQNLKFSSIKKSHDIC